MKIQILSIFPELFDGFFKIGLLGRACEQGLISFELTQLRDYAINKHGQIDDSPYGGGSGMVLRVETAVAAIEAAKLKDPKAKVILLTPRGQPFSQAVAHELLDNLQHKDVQSNDSGGLIFLCSRYEGVDQRILSWVDKEICIGDYVLQGGEIAAMVVIEALSRLLPGVLGNPESIVNESFEQNLLEHPHYTKPSVFKGQSVPEVLLSGNHQQIQAWRTATAKQDTIVRRPDLLRGRELPGCELNVALIHYPVLNKHGEVIASSITNLDLHDIARSARTYGIANYYVVHPTKTLRRLSEKICNHWEEGYGSTYNPNRSEALRAISLVPDLDDAITDIEVRTGKLPKIITTSARDSAHDGEGVLGFDAMRALIYQSEDPQLILFGTGWGLTDEIMAKANFQLAPVKGCTDYNHLSVRAAAAIIFDRLFGQI